MQTTILAMYKPSLLAEIFEKSKSLVLSAYESWEEELPADHVWRTGKLEHVNATADKVGSWCKDMSFSSEATNIICLAALAHDLGRLPLALQQSRGETVEPTEHGRLSVELLGSLQPLLGAAWVIFAEAVEKHSLRQTPPQSTFSSKEAWAVCCIIRDFDKAQGYDDAGKYTRNFEKRCAEARANKLTWTTENPSAETGSVDTLPGKPDILSDFLSGKTIIRAHCGSYEAYMLQYLAWLYDFNVPEVRAVVIREGGPGIVLSYLRDRLGAESVSYKAIAEQTKKSWGLVL